MEEVSRRNSEWAIGEEAMEAKSHGDTRATRANHANPHAVPTAKPAKT